MYYYHFDGLGSVAALSDVNSVVVERYSYDVFGEPNRVSGVNNPYLFTGRRYDDETGLYYYRARYYKPEIGRFLQSDPIGYAGGLNMYAYVGNNPINGIDPWGLFKYGRVLPVLGDYENQRFYALYNSNGKCKKKERYAEDILREGRENLPYNPLRHGLGPHEGGWDFGEWVETRNDTFILPSGGILTASQFGNYMAGYMGAYHGGILGYWGARVAGNAYGGGGPPWFFSGDDARSIQDIKHGSRDGLRRKTKDIRDSIKAGWDLWNWFW